MEVPVLVIILVIFVLALDTITSFIALFNSIRNSKFIKTTADKVVQNAYNISTHIRAHEETKSAIKPMSSDKPKKQSKSQYK